MKKTSFIIFIFFFTLVAIKLFFDNQQIVASIVSDNISNSFDLVKDKGDNFIDEITDFKDSTENFPTTKIDNILDGPIDNSPNIEILYTEIPKEGKIIVADLEQMRLFLYEDGKVVEDFPVLSKGRKGTPWETPPGAYDIKFKTDNHFSSIGGVWMPYSMQFFGNYFIHGWPYYPDGTEVSEGYSGGCIRMDTEDMKKIYDFSEVKTKVIVIGSIEKEDTGRPLGGYTKINNSLELSKLTTNSYIVADIEDGEVVFASNSREKYPIASLTKLMTALISLETLNQYKDVFVSQRAYDTHGDQGRLYPWQVIAIGDLLYPLLLESSNDAAEVIAESSGRNFFISNMNGKASSIGLSNTHFDDPSGLSSENVSTAEDLFRLSQYIYKYKSYIFGLTKLTDFSADSITWYNNSKFRGQEDYLGGKNGYIDESGQTLIAIFKQQFADGSEKEIVIILLQSDDTEGDINTIRNYIKKNIVFTPLD